MQQAAVMDNANPIGQPRHLAQNVTGHEDGRAALSGLLLEVGRAGTDIRHRYDRYPSWGKLASREEYGLPAEPPHPQDAA